MHTFPAQECKVHLKKQALSHEYSLSLNVKPVLWQGFSSYTGVMFHRSLILRGEGACIQRKGECTLINSDGSNNLTEMALPQLAGTFREKHFSDINSLNYA